MYQITNNPRSRQIYAISAVLLIFVSVCLLFKPALRLLYPLKYEAFINKYSTAYNLDSHLVMALISTESGFDKNAVSHKDAKGLMQIRDDTANWCIDKFGINESSDEAELNINIGCAYLKYLVDKYNGNTNTALAAYNAGEGNVSKWLRSQSDSNSMVLCTIPFAETENYIKKINSRINIYRFLYAD